MIKEHKSDERRKCPRLEGNIPVKICGEEFDAVTETKNLSRSGAFCRVSKYIEPMTKLQIQFLLNFRKRDKTQTKKICCEGIVVRTELAETEGQYYIAIFFNNISEKDANTISDYIQVALTKHGDEGA